MENTKAKKVLVGVLVLLLIVCLAVIIWQCVRLNSQSMNNNVVSSEKENVGSTNTDVTNKETSNTSTKTANETKEEIVTKNEYVYFNKNKVKVDGKYLTDTSLKLVDVTVNLFDEENTLSYTVTEKGGVEANYNDDTYTVKGLSKKVVEIYSVNDGQSAIETGIALMEDGTIEQLYLDGSEFKSYGTISGVKDVLRFVYVLKDNHRHLAALQANGDTVVLQGLKNYYMPGM